MKKIFIDLIIVFSFCVMIAFFSLYLVDLISLIKEGLLDSPYFSRYIVFILLNFIAACGLAVSFIFINKKDFEMLNTTIKESLLKRKATKGDRAEQKKQSRIEKLEEELNKLKNDE